MAVSLDSFLPYIAPEVVGCPVAVMKHNVLLSIINFCEKSKAWLYEHPDITTVAGQEDYPFSLPANTSIAEILSIKKDNGEDQGAQRLTLDTLRLIPVPDKEYKVSLLLSLKPIYSVADVEDFFFNEYLDAITYGAKYRLMMMRGLPWFDPDMATYYKREFNLKIAETATKFARKNTNSVLKVTPDAY